MSSFIVAARHKDGTKNLYQVSEAENHTEAYEHVRASTRARAVLVCIEGGKPLKEAPIPEDQDKQEQTA